jgi:malate synthase
VAQRNKRLPLSAAGERALLEKGTGAGLALVGGAAAGAVVKRRLTPEAVRGVRADELRGGGVGGGDSGVCRRRRRRCGCWR